MTREIWLVFFANERFRAEEGAEIQEPSPLESPTVAAWVPPEPARLSHPPHESPLTMTFPIMALALLAAVGGMLSLPFKAIEFLNDWLEPVFADARQIDPTSFVAGTTLEGISVVFGLIGLFLAYRIYRRGIPAPDGDPLPAQLGVAGRLFQHAYYFDEAIANLVRGPVTRSADWLSRVFDLGIIDGAVNGVAMLVRDTGGRLRRVQTGLVRNYALGVVIGAVALLVYLAVRAG
jgi:NADH-quinone oxidoreductase subunit L